MLADREGRLEDRPKRIKGELLPFDNQDVEPLLAELAARKFLVRYENSDGRFIQISKFKDHQTPHYSEKPSVIKQPSLQETRRDDEAISPRELQERSENSHHIKRGSQPPDSLIPDSLIPYKPTARQNGSQVFVGFEDFWKAYPRKVSKPAAQKAWKKIDPAKLPLMLEAIERQRQCEQWIKDGGAFIPHPATWLNGERWNDEQPEVPAEDAPPVMTCTRCKKPIVGPYTDGMHDRCWKIRMGMFNEAGQRLDPNGNVIEVAA